MKIGKISLLIMWLWVRAASAYLSSTVNTETTRSAHWVIRTSKLETTIEFLKKVLGMRVLRHEENDAPCPITCNGNSPTAWSKTMIGYETEDKAWALEVTYNYGVDSYQTGSGLASFALAIPNVAEAAKAAVQLGYLVRNIGRGVMVLGPDGYRFNLIDNKELADLSTAPTSEVATRAEPFLAVRLHVANLAVTQDFYSRVLGMKVLESDGKAEQPDALAGLRRSEDLVMAYSPSQVALIFRRSAGGRKPRIEQYEGRHALSMPAEAVKAAYNTAQKEFPGSVVHEIMELEEQLGTLFIAIIKDPDGFELCLVSSETFDKAVLAAADFKEPDWTLRNQLINDRAREVLQKLAADKRGAHSGGFLGLGGRNQASQYIAPPLPLGEEDSWEGSFPHVLRRLLAVSTHVFACFVAPSKLGTSEANFLVAGAVLGFFICGTCLFCINAQIAKWEEKSIGITGRK